MSVPRIVVIGAATLDIKGKAKKTLLPLTSNPGDIHFGPGGEARNVAENLARLGLETILLSAVGQDGIGATIIADVKASQSLFDRVEALGGKPMMWKTGHSLIKSKMKETGSPLAGEMSGHVFFAHRYYGFDDALYAAVQLIESVGALGQSVTAMRGAMAPMVNTPELRFQVDESRKFAVVEEVLDRLSASGARVDRTDGARVMTADGWWLLRASNTQDVLVARAEAADAAGLARLMAEIDEQLALSQVVRGAQAGH